MGVIYLAIFIPVLLLYLFISAKSIGWTKKRFTSKWAPRAVLALWILLPTWDSIVVLTYHRYVCATAPDIGLTVYQTVKLDPKLFDSKTGKPMIFDKWGDFDKNIVGKRFEVKVGFGDRDVGQWPLLEVGRQ